MKKASQIVFLVDVDCIELDDHGTDASGRVHLQQDTTEGSGDVENEILTNSTLHQICLRFLSYFAAQQQYTSSVSTLVKWGYKFYRSRSSRTVHQRYQFRDFDVQSLTQFAVDLKGQLRRSRDTSGDDRQQSSASLERAIRELICDFPWDSPYISSPVKVKKNCIENPGDGSSSVDNYVILMTELPSSSDELHGFLGTSPPPPSPGLLSEELTAVCWPTVRQILECIAPPNVRQLMCNVAKIRLLWLDAIPLCYNTVQKVQYGQQVKHTFELVHEALTTIGGGIVPLGTVLLHDTLCDGFGKSVATCHRFHFPESYRLRAPFASVLSVYSNYLEIPAASSDYSCDAIFDVPSTSFSEADRTYGVQLLPLFKKLSCPHGNDGDSINVCACGKNPRVLIAIGTMTLSDMRTQMATETNVFVCCPNEADAGLDFRDLLDDLCTDDKALVVSSQKSCVGLLVPANDDACIAVLYMLLGKAQPCTDFSNGADAVDLVFKFMTPWKKKPSSDRVASGDSSTDFLNRWLREKSDGACQMNKAEEELIGKLQKSHRSSVKTSDQHDNNRRRSPRLSKRPSCSATSQRTSNVSVSKSLFFSDVRSDRDRRQKGSDNKANGELLPIGRTNLQEDGNLGIKDLPNYEALLTYVRKVYATALHGERDVVGAARDIVGMVLEFHRNLDSGTSAKNGSVRFLVQDVFRSSKDLTLKHKSASEPSKSVRIQETYLQVVTRLEMQQSIYRQSRDFEELVDEITLLLRSLSFVAGPAVLSGFLRDTLIKNYYDGLRDLVRAICEELNQPCTDERSEDDSDGGSTSSMPVLSSPVDIAPAESCLFKADDASSSMFSQLSMISNFSASSNGSQSKVSNRRSDITQHHSFVSMSRKRQIIIPRVSATAPSKDGPKSIVGSLEACKSQHRPPVDGEKQQSARHHHRQRSQTGVGFPATNKHITPQKRDRLTTPKGRHVLKTKKVAETPVNRQVSHVALARQRSKRKLISDDEIAENISGDDVIAETPEKLMDERLFRRSPRQHASSLERRASFYSSESQSRNLSKAESNVNTERASQQLLLDANDILSPSDELSAQWLEQQQQQPKTWSTKTPHRAESLRLDPDTSPVKLTTPKSKARVKRHLNLSRLTSPAGGDDDVDAHYENARKRLHRSQPDEDEDNRTRLAKNEENAVTAVTQVVAETLLNGTELDAESRSSSKKDPSEVDLSDTMDDVTCDEEHRTRSTDITEIMTENFQNGIELGIECRSLPSPSEDHTSEHENIDLLENVVCDTSSPPHGDEAATCHENVCERLYPNEAVEDEDCRLCSIESKAESVTATTQVVTEKCQNGMEPNTESRLPFNVGLSETEEKDLQDVVCGRSSSSSPDDETEPCYENTCGDHRQNEGIEDDHQVCAIESEEDPAMRVVAESITQVVTEAVMQVVTETVTQVVTEVVTQEVTEAVTQEVTEVITQEVMEAVTQEVTEAVTQVVTEAVTQEVMEFITQEVTEAVTQVVTEAIMQEVTEAIMQVVTEALTQEVTEAVTQKVTEAITQEVTEAATQEVMEAITQEVTEAITQDVTEAVMQVVTEAVTQEVTESVTQAVMEAVMQVVTGAEKHVVTEAEKHVETEDHENGIELDTESRLSANEDPSEEKQKDPMEDMACVMSSPLRNGCDSPTETCITDSIPFPCGGGPLAASGAAESCSRSSSPGIPFLWPEMGFGYREASSTTIDDVEGSVWSDDDVEQDLGQTSSSSYHTALSEPLIMVASDNGLSVNGDFNVGVDSAQPDECCTESPMEIDEGSSLNLSKVCSVNNEHLPSRMERFEQSLETMSRVQTNETNLSDQAIE